MSFFESETKKAYKGHFANLLVLAMSDGDFDPAEQAMIMKIAERLELTEKDIQAVLKNPKKWKFRVPKSMEARIVILTDYVLVMISDGEIAPEEAAFCTYIAQQLELDADTVIPMILERLAASAPEEKRPAPDRTSIDADAFLSDRGPRKKPTSPPGGRRKDAGTDRGREKSEEKPDEIRVGDFAVSIVEGEKAQGDYFLLDHDQHYSVDLRNYSTLRCDADIEIDGKDMGTFRVKGGHNFTIDRPTHDDGRFTFYELMSKEGNAVGLKANQNLGLVKVTFRPEKEDQISATGDILDADEGIRILGAPMLCAAQRDTGPRIEGPRKPHLQATGATGDLPRAGGTGLSGQSDKKFTDADSIEHNPEGTVVIHLRLGARVKPAKDGPRELKPHPRSNKVPPPLT